MVTMKVLMTGATGLIGRAITKALHKREITVHYLTTNSKKIVCEENLKGFLWNPSNGTIDLESFNGVDAIINLAGSSIAQRWSKGNKAKILSSRVDSLKTLHAGLKKVDSSQIQSMVSASAIGIYPNSLSNFYDGGNTEVDNSFLGEVVEKWEQEADTFRDFDFNVTKVRIGVVLSISGGALPQMARPIKSFMGAVFGKGDQWQSWIHIDDLAEMFAFIIESKLKGVFNGVAPNPVTHEKMTKELARVLGYPLILPNIPNWFMKLILGEMSYLLFASQRVSSKRIEKKGFQFQYPNIGGALEQLYGSEIKNGESSLGSLEDELA